jgi:hypothetical protein
MINCTYKSPTPRNEKSTHSIHLRGSAVPGNRLTAGVFNEHSHRVDKDIDYQWQEMANEAWVDISGETDASVMIMPNLIGKKVRALARVAEADGYNYISSTSVAIRSHNPIVLENNNLGTADWKITNLAENHEIEGYSDATSVNAGQSLDIRVSMTPAGRYNLDVYRLGYYGGAGGRLMASVVDLDGATQSDPIMTNPETRLIECKWDISYNLKTSEKWTSGLYVVKLTESKSGKQTLIPFVLRDDNRPSDIGFQDAVNTAQAYNTYGGFSAYDATSKNNRRAYQVSFNRPYDANYIGFTNSDGYNCNNMLSWEYNMVRWLESQGYDLSYYTNIDVHNNPTQLYSQRAFLSVGHDEYWSMEQRDNVERALSNGVNLAFFSANTAYWQVRLDSSGVRQGSRVMSIYKDVSGIGTDAPIDPIAQTDPQESTTLFRSKEINRPENSLLGVGYVSDHGDVYSGFDFVVSNASDPCYANTGLRNGDKLRGLVGYEWDAILDNSANPAQLIILSQSPTRANQVLPPLPGKTNPDVSHAVRYRARSGAIVFSIGSIQWVWGLDNDRVTRPPQLQLTWRRRLRLRSRLKRLIYGEAAAPMPTMPRVDNRAQQIAVNIFSEMEITPQTPSPGVILT